MEVKSFQNRIHEDFYPDKSDKYVIKGHGSQFSQGEVTTRKGKRRAEERSTQRLWVSGCEKHNCVQTSGCLGASLHFNTIPETITITPN